MIPAAAPLVWVTRTAPDNERTAAVLLGSGYRAICVPVLEIEPIVARDTCSQPYAIVFTSPNGVRFHPRDHAARQVPVFAVGGRTAHVASEAGYSQVTSADGDVNDLGSLIARTACRGSEVRCYGAEAPAGDLVGDLRRNGFQAEAVPVYRTVRRSIATIHEDLPIGGVDRHDLGSFTARGQDRKAKHPLRTFPPSGPSIVSPRQPPRRSQTSRI